MSLSYSIPERLKEKFGLVHITLGIRVPSFISILIKVNEYCSNKRAGCQTFFLFVTWGDWSSFIVAKCFRRFYLFTFREKGREREREGEKHQCGRETSIICLLHVHNWEPGLLPRHVHWNWTSNLLVHGLMLNPLSHTRQGSKYF